MTQPSIPIRNLYHLFCYAWKRFEEAQALSTGAEESPDLPNLLAHVLAIGVRSLLRRGLDRGYLPLEEELSTIRGHVELGPTLRLQARSARRIQCTYDELSHDVLHNQLLKATLKRLAKANTLDRGLARDLQLLALRMSNVSDIRLSSAAFARVQLHRNNARYDLLIKICALAFECMLPVPGDTGYSFQDVLRDESKMAHVFEGFVRNYFRATQPTFRVKPLQLEWQGVMLGSNGIGQLPLMRTDVYLESVARRIIIDTKYYAQAMQEHHGTASFRSDNLYQLFAYLRNDALRQPHAVIVEGILLYPKTGHEIDASYMLHGHQVRLATVDLAQPWQSIEKRLAGLLEPIR